jgi:hypothetical protein
MQKNIFFHYTAIISCIALIVVCFIPWVHYTNINETFTGFHVKKFVTGNNYGRAGILITIFTLIIFLCNISSNLFAKRANLFICALLFAYCIRTYIIFTSALFEGKPIKLAGIYLIIFLSAILLVCAAFPRSTIVNAEQ